MGFLDEIFYGKGAVIMTKEEMQRFLNREAENGNTEEGALKALAEILGIKFPKINDPGENVG